MTAGSDPVADLPLLADFDPGLFGLWDAAPAYAPPDLLTGDQPLLMAAAKAVVLELKSAEAQQRAVAADDEMQLILNGVTEEMRDQFTAFRKLRGAAEAMLQDGDETAQKLARADIKAATDAMSLIVRTLEKIDGLQRQFARDRELAAERAEDEGGYEEAVRAVEMLIETKVQSLYRRRCVEQGLDPDEPGSVQGHPPQPPDTG